MKKLHKHSHIKIITTSSTFVWEPFIWKPELPREGEPEAVLVHFPDGHIAKTGPSLNQETAALSGLAISEWQGPNSKTMFCCFPRSQVLQQHIGCWHLRYWMNPFQHKADFLTNFLRYPLWHLGMLRWQQHAIRVPGPSLGWSIPHPTPAKAPGKAGDGLKMGPYIHMAGPDGVSGSCLQAGTVLAAVPI